jgi:3'-5' exoribonuclease
MLSFLDDLDAKMNITEQLRRKMGSQEMVWTEYQRSLERFLYLSGFGAKEVEPRPENRTDTSTRQPSLF